MTISNLPPPPNRSTQDRAEFVLTADAFLAALPVFVSQVNDTASDVDTAATLAAAAAIDAADDADRAEAAAGYRVSVAYKTYAQLAATSAAPGTTAAVFGPDAGTHIDPVVGGTVNNLGVYRYSVSPAGWERLTSLPNAGTVTSVNVSGGTTGLTATGGPITTSGTITLGGTLAVTNGGTGTTTSTGTGSVVRATSPTISAVTITAPTLGGGVGNTSVPWFTSVQNTLNNQQVLLVEERVSAGTDWNTTRSRLYTRIDATDQTYIDLRTVGFDPGIAFGTGAAGSPVERMRIDQSGNVGIGTTTPGAGTRLNVAGRGLFTGGAFDPFDGTASGVSVSYDTANNIGFVAAVQTGVSTRQLRLLGSPITFFISSGSEAARIDAAGNFGIGIATPAQKLHVASGSAFIDGNVFVNTGSGYWLTGSGNFANGLASTNSGADLSFFTGSTNRFTIASTGGITSADLADAVGYKGLPQNAKTASYTLALSDMAKDIYLSGTTSGQSITIPANGSVAFPVGTVIQITNDSNQNWTIPITTDTLVLSPGGSTGTRTLAAFGQCTIRKVSATRWWISGVGLT